MATSSSLTPFAASPGPVTKRYVVALSVFVPEKIISSPVEYTPVPAVTMVTAPCSTLTGRLADREASAQSITSMMYVPALVEVFVSNRIRRLPSDVVVTFAHDAAVAFATTSGPQVPI